MTCLKRCIFKPVEMASLCLWSDICVRCVSYIGVTHLDNVFRVELLLHVFFFRQLRLDIVLWACSTDTQ